VPADSIGVKAPVKQVVRIVLAVIAGCFAFYKLPKPLLELSRTEFIVEVREGHVSKVVIEDEEVLTGESSTRGPFRTAFKMPDDATLVAALREMGVEVVFEKSTPGLI
jgi:hypothetical protein